MDKPYFIMMYFKNFASPIVKNDDGDVAFYGTIEEARQVAQDHHGCHAFGFEIFKMGEGES